MIPMTNEGDLLSFLLTGGLLIMLLEVFVRLDRIGFDCGIAFFPLYWANFTMFVVVLEGLYQAEDLINAAPDRRLVERVLAEDALGVDEVSCANSVARILVQAAIFGGQLAGKVREENVLQLTNATVLARNLRPGIVGIFRINRGAKDDGIDLVELLQSVVE